jgi:hypothetical protein
VVRDDGTVLAYLCDGKEIGAWSAGALDGSSGTLSSPSKPAVVGVALDGRGSSATIETTDGKTVAVPLERLGATDPGGLFRQDGIGGDGERSLTGWVVLADGRVKGTSSKGGTAGPAPTLPQAGLKVSTVPFLTRCPPALPANLVAQLMSSRRGRFPPPSFERAKLCGLPAPQSRSKPSQKSNVVVGALPAGVTPELVQTLVGGAIDGFRANVNACYARAGKRLDPPDDSKLRPITDAALKNPQLVAAADRLRAAALEGRDPAGIAALETNLRSLLPQTYIAQVAAFRQSTQLLRPREPIVCPEPAVEPARPDQRTTIDLLDYETGGETEGDHADYEADAGPAADTPAAASLSADVGWDSSATAEVTLVGILDVPAGTRKVTIRQESSDFFIRTEDGGCCGFGCSEYTRSVVVTDLGGFTKDGPFQMNLCPPLANAVPDYFGAVVPVVVELVPSFDFDLSFTPPHPGPYVIGYDMKASAWTEGAAEAHIDFGSYITTWTATFQF